MHRYVNKPPESSSISFELSAYGLENSPESAEIPEKNWVPPKHAITPKLATICMKSFLRIGLTIDRKAKIAIGNPIIAGIQEVTD